MKFPDAIYLDTNVIRSLTLVGTDPTFLELKELTDQIRKPKGIPLIIPQVVSYEWVHHHWDTYVKKAKVTKGNLRELEQLLNIPQPVIKSPEDEVKQISDTYTKKLEALGITVAKTPQNISIDELLLMAAFKIRPFEERGEKGFRDAIILYTILEEMKNKNYRKALYISNDNIFQHQDVLSKIKQYKVDIALVTSFKEATAHINTVLDDTKRRFIEYQNRKLLEFVKSKSDYIFKFIKENAEITEDFITKESFLSSTYEVIGQVESVVSFDPIEVKTVFNKLELPELKKEYPKNVEPVTISVSTRIKIIYSPFLWFNRPSVKVHELPKFKEKISNSQPQYYGMPVEKELTRIASVDAFVVKDGKGNFSELKLKNVYTF